MIDQHEVADAAPSATDHARARAAFQNLIAELARIAAGEDDDAERRRQMATPCSTR
jgi:hypothetical protein